MLPVNVDYCTITGTYVDLAGTPSVGTVEFVPVPTHLADATATPPTMIMAAPPITATLDAAGSFTVDVPATDDPDLNPTDWTYRVTVRLGATGQRFNMAAPAGVVVDVTAATPICQSDGTWITVGPPGPAGADGPPGEGVPAGGAAGEVLAKLSAADFDSDWVPASAPGVHASTHAAGSTDPVTITQAQVTGLPAALTAKADKTTTITPTAPLSGGGDLSANRTLAVSTFGTSTSGVVPASGGGTTNYLRADGTWSAPAGGGGGGITAEDAVDAVAAALVEGVGIDLAYDDGLNTITVTADKTEMSLTKADVGLGNVDNTADTAKPVSTAQAAADALKADKTTAVTTTAPLTGTGTLAANLTLGVSTFSTTTTAAGVVPGSNNVGTGSFLRADGTWALPPGAGGALGHTSYTHNATLTEPPAVSQLRFNNASQLAATKVWVSQNDEDGLDVSIGLAKILAGHQIYIQDYDDASKWVKYNVTAVSDDGAYYDFTVTYNSGPGGIPAGSGAAGRVEFQAVAPGTVGVPPGGTTGQVLAKSSATDYAVAWADPRVVTINAQTGTTYTLVLADASKLVTLTNAGAVTLTVPTNASVAYPVGSGIDLAQLGAGQVTVAAAGGVTVNATPTLKFRAQYSAATLTKLATDSWLLVGDLAT